MIKDKNMEMLACFDDAGNRIKPRARKEIHGQPLQFWHAVVNIWVINSQEKILCTKRSIQNEGNPNKWQTYVGGHVKHGDSFEETAIKELNEELGLTPDDGRLIFFKKEKGEPWKHIVVMYVFFWNGKIEDVNMKDGEIDDARWMNFNEYIFEKDTHPEQWCNNISPELYKDSLKLR